MRDREVDLDDFSWTDAAVSFVLAVSVPALALGGIMAALSAASGNRHWPVYLPTIAVLLALDAVAWLVRRRARRARRR
jgi:uncharacterized protein (TIGR03382 family)